MIRRFAATAAVAVTMLVSPAVLGAGAAGLVGATAAATTAAPTTVIQTTALQAAAGQTAAHPTADTYPSKQVKGTVSRAAALSGTAVTFAGGGFKPLTEITITSVVATGGKGEAVVIPDSIFRSIHADISGAFSVAINLGRVGVDTLVATGLNPAGKLISVTSIVTVMPFSTLSLGSAGNSTYQIGTQLWVLAGGVAAIGIALLVLVSRRRPALARA